LEYNDKTKDLITRPLSGCRTQLELLTVFVCVMEFIILLCKQRHEVTSYRFLKISRFQKSRVSGDCQGSIAATAVALTLQNRLDIQIILYLF
jgi:hypothetical protein